MFHAFKKNYQVVTSAVFAPPIDTQQAPLQHTQSVSVPIRYPSDQSSAPSFETDIYIHIHRKFNKIQGTYAVYSCVWRLWVAFLQLDGGALGIFKSPVCTSYNHGLFFFRFTLFFLPEQAQRTANAARGAKRLVENTTTFLVIG